MAFFVQSVKHLKFWKLHTGKVIECHLKVGFNDCIASNSANVCYEYDSSSCQGQFDKMVPSFIGNGSSNHVINVVDLINYGIGSKVTCRRFWHNYYLSPQLRHKNVNAGFWQSSVDFPKINLISVFQGILLFIFFFQWVSWMKKGNWSKFNFKKFLQVNTVLFCNIIAKD